MDGYDFRKIEKKVARELDEERYAHTMGVMYTCACLAMVHDCDLQDAQIAGLLHDCAKCIPNKKKLKMCRANKIPVTEFEKENPFLLHAKLGAFLAKTEYGIESRPILNAITWHTTGKPNMNTLEKIVYIADYIEPMRNKALHLERIRKLAFQDIDRCVYEILKDTLAYLEDEPKDIDITTKKAFLYYEKLQEEREAEQRGEKL